MPLALLPAALDPGAGEVDLLDVGLAGQRVVAVVAVVAAVPWCRGVAVVSVVMVVAQGDPVDARCRASR